MYFNIKQQISTKQKLQFLLQQPNNFFLQLPTGQAHNRQSQTFIEVSSDKAALIDARQDIRNHV